MFVTWASLSSLKGIPTSSISIPHLDKLVHFTFYAGCVILGVLTVYERQVQWSFKSAIIKLVLFSIVYGIVIEILQLSLFNREGDIIDAFANTCGAVMGAFVIKSIFNRISWLKWKN